MSHHDYIFNINCNVCFQHFHSHFWLCLCPLNHAFVAWRAAFCLSQVIPACVRLHESCLTHSIGWAADSRRVPCGGSLPDYVGEILLVTDFMRLCRNHRYQREAWQYIPSESNVHIQHTRCNNTTFNITLIQNKASIHYVCSLKKLFLR